MPVVAKKSDLLPDHRLDQNAVEPARARGRAVVVCGTLTCEATDSATSKHSICFIPADAILDARTSFVAGSWGHATTQIGTRSSATALVNAAKATHTPIAVGDAKHGQPAWQQLGLSAAPDNNQIELVCTGPANATGAGTMPFEIWYRHH